MSAEVQASGTARDLLALHDRAEAAGVQAVETLAGKVSELAPRGWSAIQPEAERLAGVANVAGVNLMGGVLRWIEKKREAVAAELRDALPKLDEAAALRFREDLRPLFERGDARRIVARWALTRRDGTDADQFAFAVTIDALADAHPSALDALSPDDQAAIRALPRSADQALRKAAAEREVLNLGEAAAEALLRRHQGAVRAILDAARMAPPSRGAMNDALLASARQSRQLADAVMNRGARRAAEAAAVDPALAELRNLAGLRPRTMNEAILEAVGGRGGKRDQAAAIFGRRSR